MLDLGVSLEDDTTSLKEQMEEELTTLVYDIADAIHDEASRLIMERSHDTGTLGDSLNVDYGNMWAKVGANTPYAKADHDGFDGHIQLIEAHLVREHTRTSRRGKSYTVKEHVRGDHARWMPQRTGKKWLDDAIKKVMAGLPEDIQNMITIQRMDGDFYG